MNSKEQIALIDTFSAHNYAPLEIVLSKGQGSWVEDVDGKRYLDMLSAYGAVNFGHCNPRILKAAERQLRNLTLTSRAFMNDQFGPFCRDLARLCKMEVVLAMNSGAEAVETSIKLARRWGYRKKGVPEGQAEIVAFTGNFHGRTTTIVSFSTEDDSRADFGPFTPGFSIARYGDLADLEARINSNTVALMVEPIQGEGGVIIPPQGYLRGLRSLCDKNNILLIADEIQTGLGRTGAIFCCEHEAVQPDIMLLGKSLGGGVVPLSAAVASRSLMEMFTPGSHGSTFGGNPLACAVGREVVAMIEQEHPEAAAESMGEYFLAEVKKIKSDIVTAVRGKGLWVAIDVDQKYGPAKKVAKQLASLGVLSKDTRKQTLRFAPPLNIEKDDLDWGLEKITYALQHPEK